jgi:hypothetical protein
VNREPITLRNLLLREALGPKRMCDVIIERVYLYVSTIFRGSLAHGLQTTCDDDEDCSSNIPTDFNFL